MNGDMSRRSLLRRGRRQWRCFLWPSIEDGNAAFIEGVVMDKDDNNLRLEIHLFFQGRTVGADWAGGFKNDYGCAVNTDLWTMYTLNNDASYAVGGPGAWQFGTLIHFNHQPASEYFGFQLGRRRQQPQLAMTTVSPVGSAGSGAIAGEDPPWASPVT